MQAALYFPAIRGREGEIQAIWALSPRAKSRMSLLVDLPTVELPFGKSLEEHIGQFVSKVTRAWGTERPLYLDLSRYGPENVDSKNRHGVEHLFDCTRQSKLAAVPVAGPLLVRESAYLEAVARIVVKDGRGAALRLHYADFGDEATLLREIEAGLKLLRLSADQVDLLLDAEGIDRIPRDLADPPVLLETLTRAVQALRIHPFRTVVFLGSSVPAPLPRHPEDQPLKIQRQELRLWKQLVQNRGLRLVRFGDTGIWSPHQLDTGGGGGQPPARVRIPLGEEQFFFKAKPSAYRDLARKAMDHFGVDRLPHSWGLDDLRRSAFGSGNVQGASGWVARDTNIHLEITVLIVEGYLREIGRLDEVASGSVRRSPWGQTTLIE